MPESPPQSKLPNHPSPVPARAGYWRVLAASVCGTRHQKSGQPGQDRHHWTTFPEGVLVVAVADGAGSAVWGEIGTDLATRTAVATVCRQGACPAWPSEERGWQTLLIEALKTTQTHLEAEAARRTASVRDLATTLIVVIATPALVAVAQIGDGATVVGEATGNLMALTTPPAG